MLALSKVHRLTPNGANTLRVDLEVFENNIAYVQYSTFSIRDSITEYIINVDRYPGTAGVGLVRDGLDHLNGIKLPTKNNNNDSSV